MTRQDFLAMERFLAAAYRREAKSRRRRYPALAEQLDKWAEGADRRIEAIRFGPLFDQGVQP